MHGISPTGKFGTLDFFAIPKALHNIRTMLAVLEITVGHWTLSYQILNTSSQLHMIGHQAPVIQR